MSANFTPEKEDYKILTPFKMQVLTNFPYIEADFDALTNYQLLCKVVEYLNGVIHNENEVTEQVNSLYNAYVNLQNYVNTYFDNLDLQEEVNNKLDEMVEQGTLQEIIADYLNSKAIFGFDSVASMKSATNLIDGSYAKTLGYYSKNDGGMATYKIRTLTNSDIVDEKSIIAIGEDDLVAELIIDNSQINSKQFGAYGDGTHDDTLSLQAAITFCETNKIKLLLSTGTYLISDELNVTGCNIEGAGCKNTTILINNCDGLLLKQYNSQDNCKITGFSIKSTNLATEYAGIIFYKYDTIDRSRGYVLENLYFYNLGCAILLRDCFRTTVNNCNMNYCLRAIWLTDQVVQCTFTNIISNCDVASSVSSTRFADTNRSVIGFQCGRTGEAQRPEGIKLNNVCCTNHKVGLLIRDVLYFDALQCEFDYCEQEGVIVYAFEGHCLIGDSWIASDSTTDEPIVNIKTVSLSTKYKLDIINNVIVNVNGHADKKGIACGLTEDQYFINCVNISNNIIKNMVNSTPLHDGIFINRGRNCTITNNQVLGCTYDILFIPDVKGTLINNYCENLRINTFSGTKLYAYANMYTTLSGTQSGTTIGDLTQ